MSFNCTDSKYCDKQEIQQTEELEKEFFISVFFDGTNNKMNVQQAVAEQERGGAKVGTGSVAEMPDTEMNTTQLRQKDTNVAALSTLVDDMIIEADGKKKYYYGTYIEGPGTKYDGDESFLEKLKTLAEDKVNSLVGMAVGMWNQGVIAKVAKAVSDVHYYLNSHTTKQERAKVTLHFIVFGFSRGAACARLFSYLVARANDDNKEITFEFAFKDYLDGTANSLYTDRLHFLDDYQKEKRLVEFLGIYDTVSSIGLIDENDSSTDGNIELSDFLVYHNMNAHQYGLYSPQLENVKRTFHICAIDEFRKNFAITDVGKNVPGTCIEVFVPGCHSDVGGGYEDNDVSIGCLKMKIDGKDTFLAMVDPCSPVKGKEIVSEQSLMALGWVVEKGFLEYFWDNVSSNLSINSYPLFDLFQGTVSFKRTVKRGLSNITLKMMWQRVNNDIKKVWGFSPFNTYSQLSAFAVPEELKSYAALMDSSKLIYGQRSWIIPDDSLSSPSYRFLRSKYIHFSASDRVGCSIVNGPNWKDNLLCRIVYHGDRNDSGKYYMQDYT